MERLTRPDVVAAISEYSDLMGGPWSVPYEAGVAFMLGRYQEASILTVSETTGRYLGCFDNPEEMARSLAVQTYPPESAEQAGEFAAISWTSWPFNHIDWAAAAAELQGSIALGTIQRVLDTFYFDAV